MNIRKRIIIVTSILFMMLMAAGTIFSQDIGDARRPKVRAVQPEYMDIEAEVEIEIEDEIVKVPIVQKKLCVPATALYGDKVYVLEKMEESFGSYYYLSGCPVVAGEAKNGYVCIISGLAKDSKVVVESDVQPQEMLRVVPIE